MDTISAGTMIVLFGILTALSLIEIARESKKQIKKLETRLEYLESRVVELELTRINNWLHRN